MEHKFMMKKYRKKAVVIDAIQWDGTEKMADKLINSAGINGAMYVAGDHVYNISPEIAIPTLECVMSASPGDWIVKGIAGEFYPVKPDIFKATYDLEDDIISTPI
jgi:hypothetical protein